MRVCKNCGHVEEYLINKAEFKPGFVIMKKNTYITLIITYTTRSIS